MLNLNKHIFLAILIISIGLLFPYQTFAQKDKQVTRVLFIFDASQSMYAQWDGNSRMEIAKELLSNMLDSLDNKENLQVGLRCYGHQKPSPPQDCRDTRLEVPFGNNTIPTIKNRLKTLRPKGTTPIAKALESGALDFPAVTSNSRNIVILITDGIEECGGDPCAVSRLFQEKKIILKPFVIGIGLSEEYKKNFECVGTFYDARNPDEFKNILDVVISQVLNSTTAQVNLLDENEMPTETNVPLSFYDSFSGILQYNFIHTMNTRGNPDTLNIDPVLSYKVVAHTIPQTEAEGDWKLIPGKHTTIPIKCPQGTLSISSAINKTKVECIIREKGKTETLNVQQLNTKQRYLTGEYDLEILTLPRIYETVRVNQSESTNVKIPEPGLVVLSASSSPYGSIFEVSNELKWVCDLNTKKGRQALYLLPGKYKVVYRAKNASSSEYTKEKTFKVSSIKTVSLKL
ncbi:MAG: VWA domain-containing protein [Flavobacteriia bacterium]|nr:VWA domain-containing protein [Flavobacteriia bacterium]